MGYNVIHFKSLASTQDKAKEFSKKGLSNIVIVADTQTKGRGRFKRKWHSGKNGLWMSILLRPKKAENLQYLTFAASVAVVKAIKKITGLKTSIKWPNDVHFKKKKLCGILTESVLGKKNIAVVGIGLNVNQKKFPREIRNTAASLRIIKHRFYNIKTIMSEILREFFSLYEGFYAKNKLDYVAKLWKKHCDTTGKEIIVLAKGKRLYGKALGIGKDCSLLLKLKNETIIKIVEGDVRIRY